MSTQSRMIDLLPYYLQDGENIQTYYKVLAKFYDELINVFLDIIDSRDLDISESYGLDIIGTIVEQMRETGMDDETYRNRLRTKVMQNNSRGYVEDINQLGRAFLGDNFTGVVQGYTSTEMNKEPAAIKIQVSGNESNANRKKFNARFLKCGFVKTGAKHINRTPEVAEKLEYTPLFLPNMENAVAIGVRVIYQIQHKPAVVEIIEETKMKINLTGGNIEIQEGTPVIHKYSILEAGMRGIPAELGVLL